MKLEVGKRYVRKDGKITALLTESSSSVYPFIDEENFDLYTREGFYRVDRRTDKDLVAEYVEEKPLPKYAQQYFNEELSDEPLTEEAVIDCMLKFAVGMIGMFYSELSPLTQPHFSKTLKALLDEQVYLAYKLIKENYVTTNRAKSATSVLHMDRQNATNTVPRTRNTKVKAWYKANRAIRHK